MDLIDSREARKRKRCESDEETSEDFKAWDDPTLLEEMGLGLLGSDVSDDSHEGEIKDLLESPPEESACENEYSGRDKKKRKLNDHRDPLKEQQLLLVLNEACEKECKDDEDVVKLEKMKPSNCVIKNSQISYGKENVKSNDLNDVITTTEEVCKSELKLSRLSMKDKPNQLATDYFSQMPEELILEILKKLDRKSVINCRLVSRQLNRLASDESLWTCVDLGNRTLPPSSLYYMMRRGLFIVRLASACISEPAFAPKQMLKNYVCRIQYLDLSMASISEDSLATFLRCCSRLKKLSVENCGVNAKVASSIAKCAGLEVLNMAMCTGLTNQGLTAILDNCKRLVSLNLAWTHISLQGIDYLSKNLPASIERLNISGCRRNIADKHVVNIMDNCVNLRELDISDCIELTEKTIECIVERDRGLEFLGISRCYCIPIDCLSALKSMGSLLFLDMFGLCTTDRDLQRIKTQLGNLSLNMCMFSSVARPTVGVRRTSVWGLRVRD